MLKKLVTLIAVLGMTVGTALATSGTAAATGSDRLNSCSNAGGGRNNVACSGTINGNRLEIEIKNVKILSDNEINVLNVEMNNFLNNNVVTVKDVQTKVIEIFIGKLLLPITVCQVKVVEIGKVNINVAKC